MTTPSSPPPDALPRVLGLGDAILFSIGIMIGSGIFRAPARVSAEVGDLTVILAIWVAGGLASIAGALVYAELASTYPRSGGDYHYLHAAFGPWAAFLFGWSKVLVVRPAVIAMIASVAGSYAMDACGVSGEGREATRVIVTIGFIVALSLFHLTGTTTGVRLHRVFTLCKLAGLLAIVAGGLLCGSAEVLASHAAAEPGVSRAWTLGAVLPAFLLVMGTYGGYGELAVVAGDVRRPERDLPRALLLGTLAVMAIYLAVVLSLHALLSPAEMSAALREKRQLATLAVERSCAGWFEAGGGRWIGSAVATLVVVSALGAANGLVLSGSRIAHAFGQDTPGWRFLGVLHAGTPRRAILFQMGWASTLVLYGHFEALLVFAGFGDWLLYSMTALALPLLRRKDPGRTRPYRAWLPLVFPVAFGASLLLFADTVYEFLSTQLPFWWVSPGLLALGPVYYALFVRGRRVA